MTEKSDIYLAYVNFYITVITTLYNKNFLLQALRFVLHRAVISLSAALTVSYHTEITCAQCGAFSSLASHVSLLLLLAASFDNVQCTPLR